MAGLISIGMAMYPIFATIQSAAATQWIMSGGNVGGVTTNEIVLNLIGEDKMPKQPVIKSYSHKGKEYGRPGSLGIGA